MIPTTLKYYVLFFFTCSFLGWVMEVTCKLVKFHRFINRGYLVGPLCPIYGFGAVIIGALLTKYNSDPWWVLILSMVLCGTLEYMTSWLMEKLFHARWWDYSHRRFNLNGRICAGTLIPFGVMGLAIVYLLEPLCFSFYGKLSGVWLDVICIVLLALTVNDFVISSIVMKQIRSKAENAEGDSTESITKAVREKLFHENGLLRRVLDAFPYARLYNSSLLKSVKERNAEIRTEIKEKTRATVDEINQRSEKLRRETKAYNDELRQKKKELQAEAKEYNEKLRKKK